MFIPPRFNASLETLGIVKALFSEPFCYAGCGLRGDSAQQAVFASMAPNSSNLSGISCIGMSFDLAIFAMEYSSSVRQSSNRQSAGFDASNNVETSLQNILLVMS